MTDSPGQDRPTESGRRPPPSSAADSAVETLAEALPALLWRRDDRGRCTWFNARWLQFVGADLADEGGDGWAGHVHPDDRRRYVSTFREAVEARAPLSLEYRLRRHDGVYRWMLDRGSAVNDAEGRFAGFVGVAIDITEQMKAGRAQAFLAAIVESSDDAIIAKDLDGIIQSCNATAERLFGYTAAELVGRPVRILIPPERQYEEDDILARIHRGERVDHFETVRVRKDGGRLNISLTISPVRDFTGEIIGVSEVARDVTAQKRSAAELESQRSRLETTLRSIRDAVITTDEQGRILLMNDVAETLTGWRATHAIGRPAADVFRVVEQDTGREVDDPVWRVLDGGQAVGPDRPSVLIAADGARRPIDASIAPIKARDGRIGGVVLVFRDVTERHRAEAERLAATVERERLLEAERAARAEAERASRVKDDFVAMVSHELRTPLNAILGWTQLMMQGADQPEVMQRGLEVVARNTRVQAQLISDLLDISRIVVGKLQLDIQRIDLGPIVSHAIEAIQGEAESKGVALVRRIAPDAGPVAGDPARLQQVIWNLLSNAIKFTPQGGTVTVSLQARDDGAEIRVVDTGAGMRADVLPHVFDRFQQADRSITRRYGGLGLGLAIVKHLVDLHGGTVHAESPGEGAGSTFTVVLPSSSRLDVPRTAAMSPNGDDSPSLDGVRVLLVEDEPDTREFLQRLLEAHGATVIAAVSADDALGRVGSARPDIIVSDIGLPDVDGYELIRRVRHHGPAEVADIPAVALTAYARSEDRMRALRAGFQNHLAKPIEGAELIAAVASFRGVIEAQQRRRGQD